MDLKQQGRFTKDELSIIRSAFKGEGEEKLIQIRNFFCQLPHEELHLTEDVIEILRKELMPSLDSEAPLTQLADSYFSLERIKEIDPTLGIIAIKVEDIRSEYVSKMFEKLENKPVEVISLLDLKKKGTKTEEIRLVEMEAYLNILGYVQSRLDELKILANKVNETPEEKANRLKANSNK